MGVRKIDVQEEKDCVSSERIEKVSVVYGGLTNPCAYHGAETYLKTSFPIVEFSYRNCYTN